MRAVVCRQFGPPESLVVEDVDDPHAGPGQLVIEMRAASVTYPDVLIIEDKYQFKAKPPFVPGSEVAGVVCEVGEGVEGFAVGDAVVGAGGVTGGFAEKVRASAAGVRRLPAGLDFAQAAGLLYSYGTGWYALRYRGALRAGETLVVLGAAGNVGLAAVELGKVLGARVVAVASSEEKRALCLERGADVAIATDDDLKARIKELTGGAGADVVYDAIGGDYAEPVLRATGWGGRYLVIGFTAGIPRIPLNLTLLKSCQIVGVFFGAMAAREPETAAALQRELMEMVADGRLAPYVSERYPLARAAEALASLRDRRARGKVVLVP
ncbi:MAG: NADPH:quinone oxidoreductase family protein [Myxococcota bacterium]|nr:NADPH:quinone oxidoreductase family protein [Myxococcales bacterium]